MNAIDERSALKLAISVLTNQVNKFPYKCSKPLNDTPNKHLPASLCASVDAFDSFGGSPPNFPLLSLLFATLHCSLKGMLFMLAP